MIPEVTGSSCGPDNVARGAEGGVSDVVGAVAARVERRSIPDGLGKRSMLEPGSSNRVVSRLNRRGDGGSCDAGVTQNLTTLPKVTLLTLQGEMILQKLFVRRMIGRIRLTGPAVSFFSGVLRFAQDPRPAARAMLPIVVVNSGRVFPVQEGKTVQ